MKRTLLFVLGLSAIASVAMADTVSAQKTEKTVTVKASDKPVRDVVKAIADMTGETILVEKAVDGKITMIVQDVTAEKALEAIAEALNIQWRKIYVDPSSAMAKDADTLATQMRMVLSLRFPDMIVSEVGAGSPLLHAQSKATVNDLTKALPKSVGLKAVYLLTDDEKSKKKEIDETSKKNVAKYSESYKELLDMFVKMTPEERKAVMQESMGLSMGMMQQIGPDAMRDMMSSMFEMDPQYMSEMNKIGMQAIFSMSPEARRTILRNSVRQQMELMNSLSPEQMQELQQEAAAAAAEVMSETGANPQ